MSDAAAVLRRIVRVICHLEAERNKHWSGAPRLQLRAVRLVDKTLGAVGMLSDSDVSSPRITVRTTISCKKTDQVMTLFQLVSFRFCDELIIDQFHKPFVAKRKTRRATIERSRYFVSSLVRCCDKTLEAVGTQSDSDENSPHITEHRYRLGEIRLPCGTLLRSGNFIFPDKLIIDQYYKCCCRILIDR